jgi:hypothetical protein
MTFMSLSLILASLVWCIGGSEAATSGSAPPRSPAASLRSYLNASRAPTRLAPRSSRDHPLALESLPET